MELGTAPVALTFPEARAKKGRTDDSVVSTVGYNNDQNGIVSSFFQVPRIKSVGEGGKRSNGGGSEERPDLIQIAKMMYICHHTW